MDLLSLNLMIDNDFLHRYETIDEQKTTKRSDRDFLEKECHDTAA